MTCMDSQLDGLHSNLGNKYLDVANSSRKACCKAGGTTAEPGLPGCKQENVTSLMRMHFGYLLPAALSMLALQ